MGVFTGSGLASRSDIIDTMMSRIITEVGTPPVGMGETIVRDRSTGTVMADNVEQWITIPALRMSSGKEMPFGYRPKSGAVNQMQSNCTHQDFTTASAMDARAFANFDGQPMNTVDEDGSSQTTHAPQGNGYAIATPYLNHWIITNPNFGALVSGNYGADERTYMYMVVEVDANVFRIHGFCDVIQLGTWTTTASGFYTFMTLIQDNAEFGNEGSPRSNGFLGSALQRETQTPQSNIPGGNTGMVAIFRIGYNHKVTSKEPISRPLLLVSPHHLVTRHYEVNFN